MKGAIALDERSNSNSNSLQHNQLVITNNEENEKVEYGNIIIKSDSVDRNEMHPFDEIKPTVIEHDDDNDDHDGGNAYDGDDDDDDHGDDDAACDDYWYSHYGEYGDVEEEEEGEEEDDDDGGGGSGNDDDGDDDFDYANEIWIKLMRKDFSF